MHRAITRAADGWLWALILLGQRAEYGFRDAAAGLAALAVGAVVFMLLKRAIKRPRPVRPGASLGVYRFDKYSFPSGHTLSAFAVAVSLGSAHHWELFPLLAVAVAVGVSRWALRLHHFSDVAAGAVLGALIGRACWSVLL